MNEGRGRGWNEVFAHPDFGRFWIYCTFIEPRFDCHFDCHSLLSLLECMAGTTGLEPATSAVTGQRSNQLSYVPGGFSGSNNIRKSIRSFAFPATRGDHPQRAFLVTCSFCQSTALESRVHAEFFRELEANPSHGVQRLAASLSRNPLTIKCGHAVIL